MLQDLGGGFGPLTAKPDARKEVAETPSAVLGHWSRRRSIALGPTNWSVARPLFRAAALTTEASALARWPVLPGIDMTQCAHTPSRRAAIPFKGAVQCGHSAPEKTVAPIAEAFRPTACARAWRCS